MGQRTRRNDYGLVFEKVRNCLKCGKDFDSYSGARLCGRCNSQNQLEYVMHTVHVPKTVQVPATE